MKKLHIFLFSGAGIISASLFALSLSLTSLVSKANAADDTCNHVGYHYYQREGGCISGGNYEFWACCNCHKQFLTKTPGTWTVRELEESLSSDHIAYSKPTGYHYYVASKDVIGYKACEDCGKLSDKVMTNEDLPSFSQWMYGSSISSIAAEDCLAVKDGIAVPGAGMLGINTGSITKFPKINYSLYESVSFEFGIDHYQDDTYYAELKLGDELLADWPSIKGGKNNNNRYQYILRVDNKIDHLDVSFTRADKNIYTKTVQINDENIINGSKPLFINGTSYHRTIYLNGIDLTLKQNKIYADGLRKGELSEVDIEIVNDNIGDVRNKFTKISLPSSTTGLSSKVNLSFNPISYNDNSKNLMVKMFVACDSKTETTTNMKFFERPIGKNSLENTNIIKSLTINNNSWIYVDLPTLKLLKDNTLSDLYFCGDYTLAKRTYYIEYIRFYNYVNPVEINGYSSLLDAKQNDCNDDGISSIGNRFDKMLELSSDNKFNVKHKLLNLTIGEQYQYILDRFYFLTPLEIGFPKNIVFTLYLEAQDPNGDTQFILCEDHDRFKCKYVNILSSDCNKWIELKFENINDIAPNGILDHFNFGIWASSALRTGDNVIISKIAFVY